MTISATTNRVTYTGNGATTAFAFAYPFHSQADLVVIETVIATGVQTTKALTTDYTVSGTTDAQGHYPDGGTVTALTAPASTVTWTIYRDPSAVQSTDFVQNDDLPAESLESALDYQTLLNQRTRDMITRSLRQPEGDSTNIDYLPAKVTRASKYLAFDSDGSPVAVAGTAGIVASLGASGVIGCDCKNNSGTPNTQFDLDADVVVLSNSSQEVIVRVNPGAAITNNVSTAGPAANGRDQAGAFSAGSWVHFYWIWNGSTLATLSSATAPPTGPTLPSGYTHWAYAGAVYFDGSSHLSLVRIKGNTVFYETQQAALSGGSATVETAVSLATLIPPNALNVRIKFQYNLTTNAGGSAASSLGLRAVSGSTLTGLRVSTTAASNVGISDSFAQMPNISQNLYYIITSGTDTNPANVSSRSVDIHVLAYTVPNGGE